MYASSHLIILSNPADVMNMYSKWCIQARLRCRLLFQNQVALKKDNKYVVLTFILVGSIAGILLAVVVIYIIKRHTRSKEKLAQLSTTGEGNEASKDYQVSTATILGFWKVKTQHFS